MRFAIFPVHVSEVSRLPRKSDARSYEVLHLSRNITLANLKIWCSKMPPLSGNQRPDLLTSRKCPTPAMVFGNATRPSRFCSLLTRCAIPCADHAKRHLNVQKSSEPVIFLHFWLRNVLRATMACTCSTSQLPKVVRTWCVLCILTSKCASRHNCVHFFDISTSKNGPIMRCFAHFDFQMCFAPQPCALFGHLNFQKCSEHEVFCTFWLPNVLRASTARNGVQLFISYLARWLRTRRFSEPTFRPSGATNHWKNTVNRDFSTFSCTCIFLLTLSLLWSSLFCSSLLWPFPPLLFHLSILSEVWLLNFLRIKEKGFKIKSCGERLHFIWGRGQAQNIPQSVS